MYNENQPFSFGGENDSFGTVDNEAINDSSAIFNYTPTTINPNQETNTNFNLDNLEQKLTANNSIFDTEISGEQPISNDFASPNGIVQDTAEPIGFFENPAVSPVENVESSTIVPVESAENVPSVEPFIENPTDVSPVFDTQNVDINNVKDDFSTVQSVATNDAVNVVPTVEKEETNNVLPDIPVVPTIEKNNIDTQIDSFSGNSLEINEPVISAPEPVETTENVNIESEVETPTIEMSETPIEEIEKLTEYEPDNIESTDINSLFDRVSVNFKDASDIFKRNTEMKQKIDSKFQELKTLQSELNSQKQNQMNEINAYKDEVFTKLNEKKDEIEKRLNLLKELQTNFENDRADFEKYKKDEMDNIENIKREVQEAYDGRREELNKIEDVLRKQKDDLDEERNKLSLDKIEYESNKNELANNLLKFNELVDSFTSGVGNITEK